MAVFPGTYIEIGASSNSRINHIVDNLLTPRMVHFRQVNAFNEPLTLQPDDVTWKSTYGNWNPTFPIVVRHNGDIVTSAAYGSVDYVYGTLQLIAAVNDSDTVHLSYNINWFPTVILAGMIDQVVDIINTSALGAPTEYTIDTAPDYWDGVISDLTFAMAMERLIEDFALWYGRLIFALPNLEDSGDIISILETLKRNAEERAAKTLENEKFKNGNYLSPPTRFYYAAVSGIGRRGNCCNYGKTRGWRPNRWI